MALLRFAPIETWPDDWNRVALDREWSPFTASYGRTLRQLDDELRHLGVDEALLQVDASVRDVRLDGQLRADAKVTHPGCILTIESAHHGTLVYSTDRYQTRGWRGKGASSSWQENLRAITLGLEALRKVERYGIAGRGQQYAGYKALGSGIPMPPPMTWDQAAELLVVEAEADRVDDDDLANREVVHDLWRRAARRHHPDLGGDPATFRRLTEARDLLLGQPR